MIAWVNAELVKNVAEIGRLRLLRAAAPKYSVPAASTLPRDGPWTSRAPSYWGSPDAPSCDAARMLQ